MLSITTIAEVENIITSGIEESQELEFKAADSLQNTDSKKKELAKDVSAMANANGGVIIYGLRESTQVGQEHLAESIDPIDRRNFSKETLEQIINSNISPKMEGLEILPISISGYEVIYVVKIQKANTAHQNTKDLIYYRRHNFEILKMHDYEIRDLMFRARHPKISLSIEIIKQRTSTATKFQLVATPQNTGSILANYVKYFLRIPIDLIPNPRYHGIVQNGIVEIEVDNTIRDKVKEDYGLTGMYILGQAEYGPARYYPILPKLKGKPLTIWLHDDIGGNDHLVLEWKAFADNAPENSGSIKFGDISITFQSTTE